MKLKLTPKTDHALSSVMGVVGGILMAAGGLYDWGSATLMTGLLIIVGVLVNVVPSVVRMFAEIPREYDNVKRERDRALAMLAELTWKSVVDDLWLKDSEFEADRIDDFLAANNPRLTLHVPIRSADGVRLVQKCRYYNDGGRFDVRKIGGSSMLTTQGYAGKCFRIRQSTLELDVGDDFHQKMRRVGFTNDDEVAQFRQDRKTYLCVPIIVTGDKDPIGVVCVDAKTAYFFDDDVTEMVESWTPFFARFLKEPADGQEEDD